MSQSGLKTTIARLVRDVPRHRTFWSFVFLLLLLEGAGALLAANAAHWNWLDPNVVSTAGNLASVGTLLVAVLALRSAQAFLFPPSAEIRLLDNRGGRVQKVLVHLKNNSRGDDIRLVVYAPPHTGTKEDWPGRWYLQGSLVGQGPFREGCANLGRRARESGGESDLHINYQITVVRVDSRAARKLESGGANGVSELTSETLILDSVSVERRIENDNDACHEEVTGDGSAAHEREL
jgi:hypothetical protein